MHAILVNALARIISCVKSLAIILNNHIYFCRYYSVTKKQLLDGY